MVVKLYGNYIATCTKRVVTVLIEEGVPFEYIRVGLAEMKTEKYKMNMQPFGQIPVLDDNGFKLFESRAIGRYVAAKYAGQGTQNLVPSGTDPQEVAMFEKAMSIEASQFISAEHLTFEVLTKPFFGDVADLGAVAKHIAELEKKLDGYERILSKYKYLAGDHITLADLFHLPYAEAITNRINCDALTSSKRPNVACWWNDISSRDSWKTVKELK